MSTSRRASRRRAKTSPPGGRIRSRKSVNGSDSNESAYRIVFAYGADRDLARLDKPIAARIYRKLQDIARHPHPLELAVPLTNVDAGTHRFRIGTYRAMFEIQDRTIYITRVAHRRGAY